MSTRCNLIIKDEMDKIQLYRHSDGYPGGPHGVIAGLPEALKFAWELPRMEASDFSAAIVRAWKNNEYIQGGNIYIDGTANGAKTLHGNIEYLYTIEPDKKVGKWHVKCQTAYVWDELSPKFETVFEGHIGDKYPE